MRTETNVKLQLERWEMASKGYELEFENTKLSGRNSRLDYLQESIEECAIVIRTLKWVLEEGKAYEDRKRRNGRIN